MGVLKVISILSSYSLISLTIVVIINYQFMHQLFQIGLSFQFTFTTFFNPLINNDFTRVLAQLLLP